MNGKKSISILNELVRKAKNSPSNSYRVSAVAFTEKGELLGSAYNAYRKEDIVPGRGYGLHAERRLMERYGKNISSIIICRIGHGGKLRPIDPCHTCAKIASKMGIKIYAVAGKERHGGMLNEP